MSVRSLFSIVAVAFVLSTMVAGADATEAGKNARKLKGTKTPKATKAPKSSKSTYKQVTGWMQPGRMLLDSEDRELALKYMTDRFSEEGSVRSFVDSLGFEVDLHSGRGEKEGILSKEDCESLMSLLVTSPIEEDHVSEDHQQSIDETELVSIIGKVSNVAYAGRNGRGSSALELDLTLTIASHSFSPHTPSRINSTPCLISTEKLSGLPFPSRMS